MMNCAHSASAERKHMVCNVHVLHACLKSVGAGRNGVSKGVGAKRGVLGKKGWGKKRILHFHPKLIIFRYIMKMSMNPHGLFKLSYPLG